MSTLPDHVYPHLHTYHLTSYNSSAVISTFSFCVKMRMGSHLMSGGVMKVGCDWVSRIKESDLKGILNVQSHLLTMKHLLSADQNFEKPDRITVVRTLICSL